MNHHLRGMKTQNQRAQGRGRDRPGGWEARPTGREASAMTQTSPGAEEARQEPTREGADRLTQGGGDAYWL